MRVCLIFSLLLASTATQVQKPLVLASRARQVQTPLNFWDFVKPLEFSKLCLAITKEIGKDSGNAELARSICMEQTQKAAKAAGANADEHCKYFAVQIETATVLEEYRGGPKLCAGMIQWHSFKAKRDLLEYFTTKEKHEFCSDIISDAIDQGTGVSKEAALQANLPVACKEVMETAFKKQGLPYQIATTACKGFVTKANKALSSKELDPSANGKQFCDGNSMQSTPFAKSEPAPMPEGFPLTKGDWVPKVTLASLRQMVRDLFATPKEAWAKFDINGDGKMDEAEWKAMCSTLKIVTWDCTALKKRVDKDGSGDITALEFYDAMGVTLPELVGYVLGKYKNSDASLKAADANGDGKIDEAEWKAHCAEVEVSPEQADLLWKEMDGDEDGVISAEEYEAAFGVTVPELKKRAAEQFGTSQDSFKAFDKNGDGKIDEDELKAACLELDIPEDQASRLFPLLDSNGNLDISPEEWDKLMGLDEEDVAQEIMDKLGNPAEAFKKLSGDGKPVSKEDAQKALEEAGMSPEEAKAMAAELDKDGDGKVSAEEFAKATGADKIAARKHAAPGAAGALGGLGTPEQAMKAMDADGDGVISEDEIAAGMAKAGGAAGSPEEVKKLMKEMDKDGDGKVSPEELKAAMEKGQGPVDTSSPAGAAGATGSVGGAMGQAGGAGMGPGATGGAGVLPNGEAEVTVPEFMKRAKDSCGSPKQCYGAFDKDGDGNVTPEEFTAGCANLKPPVSPAQAATLFDKLDGDGSGGIVPSEFYAEMGGEEDFEPAGLTVPEFKRRAQDTFGTPKAAFEGLDGNGDGNVTPEEFVEGCKKLKPPVTAEQAEAIFKKLDKDKSGGVSPEELYELVGPAEGFAGPPLSLPEFKKRAKDTYGSPKAAYAAMDADGDGKVTPEEFAAAAAKFKPPVSKQEALPLFEQLDKNKDGAVNPEEFYAAVGAEDAFAPSPGDKDYMTAPEFKKRAKDSFGSPKEAFAALDADGDGKITPEELVAGAAKMKPPISKEEALALVPQLDKNGDGAISADEFYDSVGSPEAFAPSPGDADYVDVPEFKRRAKKSYGSPEDAFKEFDANGDGKLSPEEFAEGCKKLKPPIPPEAVPALFKEMDKNGDGSVDGPEFYASVGPPDAFTAEKGDADFVDVPEFKKRAKATFGTPKEAYEAFDSKPADGKISADEFLAGCAKLQPPIDKGAALTLFKELDANGDGGIQPKEFYDLVGAPEGFTPSKGEEGYVGVPEFKDRAGAAYGTPRKAFAAMDANGDGKITPEEFKAAAAKMKPPIPAEQVPALFKEMDSNGDGVITADEFYAATGSPDEFGSASEAPRAAPEVTITLPEYRDRVLQAYKNGKEAWDDIAGKDSPSITLEEFKEKSAGLGLTPGQAEAIYKEIDADGNGTMNQAEYQNAIGMDEEEMRGRLLDKFPSAADALKAADKDGDGNVSKEELQEMLVKDLGVTPENAAKLADEMMKKYDPTGSGKINGKDFTEATKARASDLTDRIEEKLGSAGAALKKWDKDGDGCLNEAEFLEGSKTMGISEDAAKDMWKQKETSGTGKMCGDAFGKAFGIGGDQLRERCFQNYGNPSKAFYAIDEDGNGLMSKAEWEAAAKKLHLKPDQVKRLIKEMDVNTGERTHGEISKWEFFKYMDYEEARFVTYQDGYGDIDPFGSEEKKFNELPAQPAEPAAKKPKKALLHHATKHHHHHHDDWKKAPSKKLMIHQPAALWPAKPAPDLIAADEARLMEKV